MEINKSIVKKTLPHIVAILIFIIIGAIYFSPQLNGYRINQSDVVQNLGMKKEIEDFRVKYNSEPLWTNSMFGGMPAYQISTTYKNVIKSIEIFILSFFTKKNYLHYYY